MNLDIRSTMLTIVIITAVAVVWMVFQAIKAMRSARRLPFYFKRREQILRGWRSFFFALILAGLSFLIYRFGEPIAY